MCQDVISLSKKDKDPLNCGSHRPSSLLNTEAKILAKFLARQLERVVPTIVPSDQTGFEKIVKLSSTLGGCPVCYKLLVHPVTTGGETILSLDAEKAFEQMECGYFFESLKQFKFGPKVVSCVKLIYTSPVVAVHTDISSYFELQQDTR